MTSERFETVDVESKVREGYFHKVVKDLETGLAVSCSCKCWTKGNKPCAAMRSIGYESPSNNKI
ncbi:hypothetical protein [Nitrosopumilus sp.]|uniref:hypothetical protein n=1 Tax=Nitrosopumilus sp. TaxID=2024843 RepID=UPI00261590D4|nr:hypothetical protein [Nitrosopumilus sp.]